MRQISDYSDNRTKGFCVHCGGRDETRDHSPSKVFLDSPYPENLPVSPACLPCNNGFALDEQYLACLIECVIAGDVAPEHIERSGIRRILQDNVGLRERLRNCRSVQESGIFWSADTTRVSRVLLKLARCHAAFENGEPQLEEPKALWFRPLALMNIKELKDFESPPGKIMMWPEVGSRAMQRLLIAEAGVYDEGWIVVQEERYRYRVDAGYGLTGGTP